MKLTVSLRCLFVYGTLRRGECNHALLGTAPFLGQCRTAGRYTLFNLGRYPAAIAGGRTAIVGEVYVLNKALLARLDRLEDYPQEYIRVCIATPYGSAWIYLYRWPPAPETPVIFSGDWRFAKRPRPAPPALRRRVQHILEYYRSGSLRPIGPGSHSSQEPIRSGDNASPGASPGYGLFCQIQNGRQAKSILSGSYG
jgi:gamma-glutamylcyclotransferase (GGCT)/AIG2-like uncharacterized protein YtfP